MADLSEVRQYFPYFYFLNEIAEIGKISSLNVWKKLPLNPSGAVVFCLCKLIIYPIHLINTDQFT
jgi:hypothetical protein